MISGIRMPNCTCYRLRQAARLLSRNYDSFLAPCELSIGQFGVLATLAEIEGGPSISKLAEMLRMDRTTLTRNLTPLQKLGYVVVKSGPDQRSRSLTLTAAGRKSLADAAPRWKAAQREFEKQLGEPEVKRLNAKLDNLLLQLLDC
jgi:DNA-binding MarR family transcriptional regulator